MTDAVGPRPEKESDVESCISINRINLSRFIEEFQRSVALFVLLERGGGPPSVGVFGGEFISYRMIAARDGALNVYHFGCALDAIKKNRPKSPRIAAAVDALILRDAYKLFNRHFPHADNIRHAVAHAAERFSSPAEMRRNVGRVDQHGHGFSTAAGGIFGCALFERTFSVGNKGEVFSLEMTDASVSKLREIAALVEEAFGGA